MKPFRPISMVHSQDYTWHFSLEKLPIAFLTGLKSTRQSNFYSRTSQWSSSGDQNRSLQWKHESQARNYDLLRSGSGQNSD